jgi:alanyl-tRNA synthetase
LVRADRLRFDFAHPKPVTAEELAAIEAEVNAVIRRNSDVSTRLMAYDAAVEAGAMALFGEKYSDEVRVLSMGEATPSPDIGSGAYSVELCGGTHVNRLGDIGLFKIISEGAVASGVRRIEALVGEAARLYLLNEENLLKSAASSLKVAPSEVPDRVLMLSDQVKKLERDLAQAKKALAMGGASGANGPEIETVGAVQFIGQVLQGINPKDLRGLADDHKKKLGRGVVALIAVNEDKAAVLVGVTDDLMDRLSAVDLVRAGAMAVGGKGGGGRPDMAQAGGPDGAKADQAIAAIRQSILDISAVHGDLEAVSGATHG